MRLLLFTLAFSTLAFAQEGDAPAPEAPAPKKKLQRGLKDGKYVDEYFGLVYTAKDLKEGFGFGNALFTGKCAGDVEVEIQIGGETPQPMTPAQVHERMKQGWAQDGKTRTDIEHGTDPLPWTLFVEESLAGFKRHHGYGFYTRGAQIFVIHVEVQEKSDTSGAAIKEALVGLELDPDNESFFLAHMVAKQNMAEPDDPKVLLGVASGYLQDRFKNPPLALKAATQAMQHADSFTPDELFHAHQTLGLAQLTAGHHEEAVPTWLKCIELAKKTSANQTDLESNSRYNLACAYSLLKKLDEAFEELKKSTTMGSDKQTTGLKQWAQEDPDLANMRADPRWAEMFGG